MKKALTTLAVIVAASSVAVADSSYHGLLSGAFSQDWTNTGLITTNDDWSGVPSITGFLGDDAASSATGVDPQTILLETSTTVDVIANLTVTTSTAGGVGEFEITNPVVGLQGSATADAPYIQLFLNSTGVTDILVSYLLRDIDGTTDNAVQAVALQYRVGTSGSFTNVAGGFVADATTGPSLATQTTPVSILLPSDANNVPQLQVRIITSNAAGSDEWVGIDNILVTAVPEPGTLATVLLGAGLLGFWRRHRR